jgi:hypothetical protein
MAPPVTHEDVELADCRAELEASRIKTVMITRCIAIGFVALSYFGYLTLTPNPQDGILFGSVMGLIGLLAGVNINVFKRGKV